MMYPPYQSKLKVVLQWFPAPNNVYAPYNAEAAIYHTRPSSYSCNDPNGLPSLNPNYIVEIGF